MNSKGFTLMELLIVVVIIVGFAALAYPSYVSSIERARASEAVTMLGTIQAAQQKHFVNYEEYGTQFRDINDFEPAISNFNAASNTFRTEYFVYTLNSDNATAVRVNKGGGPVNKGYDLSVVYADNFVRCNVQNDDGEQVCSSLTDKDKSGNYYPIF